MYTLATIAELRSTIASNPSPSGGEYTILMSDLQAGPMQAATERIPPQPLTVHEQSSSNAKTADRPHKVSIILSMAALLMSAGSLVISGLGLRESGQNRAFSEAMNKPLLEPTNIDLQFSRDFRTVDVSVELTNVGNRPALRASVYVNAYIPKTSPYSLTLNPRLSHGYRAWGGCNLFSVNSR